ncbi:hypothetical protein ACGFX8_26755 [Streptomyces sp. NPDC048362]|uniref:hypothetical protein n=1 Tax=Streptomyces sp. NPDC048362 TaxID=3365539 RepID=UPI00371A4082
MPILDQDSMCVICQQRFWEDDFEELEHQTDALQQGAIDDAYMNAHYPLNADNAIFRLTNPACGHVYHNKCLRDWSATANGQRCSLCQAQPVPPGTPVTGENITKAAFQEYVDWVNQGNDYMNK